MARLTIAGVHSIGLGTKGALDTAAKVRKGFSFSSVIKLEKASGLSREKLSTFAAIPMRTLSRRQAEGCFAQRPRLPAAIRSARAFSSFQHPLSF